MGGAWRRWFGGSEAEQKQRFTAGPQGGAQTGERVRPGVVRDPVAYPLSPPRLAKAARPVYHVVTEAVVEGVDLEAPEHHPLAARFVPPAAPVKAEPVVDVNPFAEVYKGEVRPMPERPALKRAKELLAQRMGSTEAAKGEGPAQRLRRGVR